MAGGESDPATSDFGDQLYCSICMQVLFQPLTLIDCLHTFCGACVKDWFAHQASQARSLHPYTCPSCRASVKDTKRNAFVMTLLDMHLQAHPERIRSNEDKEEHMSKYKPGDNVMPKLKLRGAPPDADEERVLAEVTALSLREAGITDGSTLLEPTADRRRGNSRDSRSRTSSRGAAPRTNETSSRQTSSRIHSREPPTPAAPVRQVEHQSSLISLMSASEMDPQEMQEEIMRQIAEEGLLEDIDLDNLNATQEEELSERIARAYQQRSEARRRQRRDVTTATAATHTDTSRPRERSRHRRSPPRPSAGSGAEDWSSRPAERRRTTAEREITRPPISNPQLIDSVNQGQARHRRTGSSSSSRTAARIDSALDTTTVSNITTIPSTSDRRRRLSHERSATDPDRGPGASRRPHGQSIGSAPSTPRIEDTSSDVGAPSHSRPRSGSNPQRSPRLGTSSTFSRTAASSSTSSLPMGLNISTSESTAPQPLRPPSTTNQRPSSSSSASHRPTLHTEPSISCNRCNRPHIEHDVHYNCPKCSSDSSSYNICKPCFRNGKGCLHWFGVGAGAMKEFDRRAAVQGYPSNQEKPHVLTARRYTKSRHPLVPSPTPAQPHRRLTEDDPSKRLEKGVFCDLCENFANTCFWKCDACNEGEWGFCNDCVNQGKHCTHPLLPLKAREDEPSPHLHQLDGHLAAPSRLEIEQQPSPPLTPKTASIIDGPVVIPVANLSFQPLTFRTLCDICELPILPSVTRYHCPQCNGGNSDICIGCYNGLVSTGKISTANGHQGWRKCPYGHRMVIIGFQHSHGGERRVVDRDIVGGWTFAEDAAASPTTVPVGAGRRWRWREPDGSDVAVDPEHWTRVARGTHTHRYPPDGGIGLVFYSKWNWFPENAEERDLVFPKGAEIREAEDINGEWLWGVYAGSKGVFPAAYVDFLRRVVM